MNIHVDFQKKLEKIKPLHGINNGPKSQSFMRDASALWKKAGITYSRLHDTEGAYGSGEYVDIPAVFKCFDADPENPASYNFMLTDKYIESILETGAKVIYRLGVTIENGPYKKYIHPPKDYKQWARICEGIIKHYTQGWADGYENAVEYFEIWNEPEFRDHMWTGTDEEFYKLFKDTIIYLKEKFPNVKIGGPGNGNTRPEFTEGFFEYMTKGERAPLDFYSWHKYFTCIEQVSEFCELGNYYLKHYGYENTELICTEWNLVEDWNHMGPVFEKISDERGAAFTACVLSTMQKNKIDISTYYDSRLTGFNGLYEMGQRKHHDDILGVVPKPSYYAFESFNELYRLGTEVYSESSERDVCVLAASNGKEKAVLISRYNNNDSSDKLMDLQLHNHNGKSIMIYRYSKLFNTMPLEVENYKPAELGIAPLNLSPYDIVLIKIS